ncbi:protein sorting system archaetidylserine decarboxylase [Saliphagus sp. GCM10025308]
MKFAPGAWRYAIVPLVVAPFAYLISVGVGIATLLLGVGTLAFFRDPERTPPLSGVVAPADGKVSVMRTEGDRFRLGTFMNVHNVHVVRAPFDATVRDVEHSPGGFKPAFSKDSDRNEKVHLHLEPTEGAFSENDDETPNSSADETESQERSTEAEVTFIAGAFARRIHPYVEPGNSLERGQRIGHIAFGSRVDVVFPPQSTPRIW